MYGVPPTLGPNSASPEQVSFDEAPETARGRRRAWRIILIAVLGMIAIGGLGKLLDAPNRFGQAWGLFVCLVGTTPLWIGVWVLWRLARRVRRSRRLGCIHCGYGMNGVPSNRCPECGKDAGE
jgi:rubrerythrin